MVKFLINKSFAPETYLKKIPSAALVDELPEQPFNGIFLR